MEFTKSEQRYLDNLDSSRRLSWISILIAGFAPIVISSNVYPWFKKSVGDMAGFILLYLIFIIAIGFFAWQGYISRMIIWKLQRRIKELDSGKINPR